MEKIRISSPWENYLLGKTASCNLLIELIKIGETTMKKWRFLILPFIIVIIISCRTVHSRQ